MIERYFKSSLLNTLERGFYLFSALVSYAIIARALGIEQFGEFAKLIFIYQVLSFLSTSTADQAMQNSLSNANEKAFQEYVQIRLIYSLLASILTLLIFGFSIDVLSIEHYLVALIHFAFVLHSTESIIKYDGSSNLILKARLISSSSTLLLRVFGWLNEYGMVFFILTYFLEALIYGVILNILYNHKTLPLSFRMSSALKSPLFKKASYLFASAGVVVLYSRMDFLSLYFFTDSIEFGKYTAVFRLLEVFSIVVITVITSMYPYMTQSPDDEKKKIAGKLLSFILLLSITAITGYIIVGETIITLIYGQDFGGIEVLGLVLLLSIIFSSQVILTTYLLLLLELERVRLYRALIGLFISSLLVIPSTFYYGIWGAAISSFMVQTALLIMTFGLKGSRFINPIFKDGYSFKHGIKIWKTNHP